MKVISKKRYSKSKTALEVLKNEIEIQKLVKHPNIITLDYSFSDELYQYFILEYCPGPNIREYLYKSDNYRIKESEIRKILKDVIQGLIYLHDKGITHYDIKLENFIIGMDGNVKIGDFTLSTFQRNEKGKKFSIFGTFNYLSPEMIAKEERKDTCKVDIWAIGVSTFYMLTGKQPFKGNDKEITSSNILNGEFRFPLNFSISEEIKDFINYTFQRDPHKRPSAKDLLNHPFLNKNDIEKVCLLKSSSLPPLNLERNKKNDSVKQPLCQPLNDGKKKLPKHPTARLKPPSRPQLDNNKQNLSAQVNDSKQISTKQQTTDAKPPLRPQLDNNKQNLSTQVNDSKPISAKQQTTNAKPLLCPQLDNYNKNLSAQVNDSKPISAKQQTTDAKPLLCPSNNDNKQNLVMPSANNIKPLLCPPINNNKQNLVRRPTTNVKPPPLCPPLNDKKPNVQRPPTSKVKPPPLCPPLNDKKPILQKPPTANFGSLLCPPLNDNKQISPRRPAVKPTLYSPRNLIKPLTPKQHNSNLKHSQNQPPHTETRPISPRIGILGDNGSYSICPDSKQTTTKSFIIPNHFVSRYCFVNGCLNYLLIDGTVGICFKDKSRIVMDPFERFVQFYNNETIEIPDIIYLTNSIENKEIEYISLVKKASKHFKKIRFSYMLPKFDYDPEVHLHNVTSFIKNEDSILFELDDMNFQINFNDNVKMIIFWNDKKLCFFRSFKEKCTLFDWKNVASMNPNSDELKKFKMAKVLLSNLSLTIC